MDSCLTQTIPVQRPKWQPYSACPSFPGYTHQTTKLPIFSTLLKAPLESEGQLSAQRYFYRVHEFEGSGPCKIQLVKKKQPVDAYCKVTHLLDPIRTCQGYYVDPEKGERRKREKLENPMNQAYVDCVTNYILGQLRERNISPHFCTFYGGFQAIADVYKYNLTDDIESYRKYKGFWENRKAGLFDLELVLEDEEGEQEILTRETCQDSDFEVLLKTPASSMRSINSVNFQYKTPSSTRSRKTHISLDGEDEGPVAVVELESVGSLSDLEEAQSRPRTESMPSLESSSDLESESQQCEVFATFQNYPVALIFQEQNDGVLDDLLEDAEGEEVGVEQGTPEWEERWTAWLFQIIAALCCAQGTIGFTHNDLHTNNIVWSTTDQPWLWYKRRDGTTFRVPTYGKILRLIDFGRAVFRIEEEWIVSDDYARGGDAEGQISFGNHRHLGQTAPEIFPNPSFDLCRLSVSMLESLFPEMPTEKLDGQLLSKEGDWEVHETESSLWNLLWSWLIDDFGRNVLREEDGEERFPGFELYTHIGRHVHCAKPQDQLTKDIFRQYEISAKDVGEWETVYPLFC